MQTNHNAAPQTTRRDFIALALGAVATAAAATIAPIEAEAQAIPRRYAKSARITQSGITYLLYMHYAIVYRMPNRYTVTVPNTISYRGKAYTVSAIWPDALTKAPRVRRVDLKARHVDTIEAAEIWDRRGMLVICHDRTTYRWLKTTGANAQYRK